MSWPGPPPPLCAADVAIGKNCDGGAIIELLASNQLNFSQHQISTYVRQALNKGNEVGRLRIAAEFGLFSPSLSLSFFPSFPVAFSWLFYQAANRQKPRAWEGSI